MHLLELVWNVISARNIGIHVVVEGLYNIMTFAFLSETYFQVQRSALNYFQSVS